VRPRADVASLDQAATSFGDLEALLAEALGPGCRVHRSPSSPREERRRRAKKGGGTRGKEKCRARGGVVSRETTTTWGVRARQGVQDSRDIKIAKPLCLCKNAKFGPSNTKFAKIHKSNAKLLDSNF